MPRCTVQENNLSPPTMDELDVFECEVDNAKEALASKLAVISFME